MLYLKEIAQVYGLHSLNGTPHSRLITAIMNEYQLLQNKIYPEIYWSSNLYRVWPQEQYAPAMKWFIDIVKKTNATQYTFSDGKTYNFMMQECELQEISQ
jgi:hypothetical protein